MKFISTVAVLLLSTVALVNAGATTDQMKMMVPAVCSDACSAHVDLVGSCLEGLGEFSIGVSGDDAMGSFRPEGDLMGAHHCACSAEAIAASESCIACANQELGLSGSDVALSTSDYEDVCSDFLGGGSRLFAKLHPCVRFGQGCNIGGHPRCRKCSHH